MRILTVDQFKEMRRQRSGLTIINVLSQEQHRKAHIPETVNVPRDKDDFVQAVERLAGSKNRPVIVYCAGKECTASPQAARALDEAGFTEVYDFEGGIESWRESGGEIVGSN